MDDTKILIIFMKLKTLQNSVNQNINLETQLYKNDNVTLEIIMFTTEKIKWKKCILLNGKLSSKCY